MPAKFNITIRGPRAGGKSTFIHQHLIPALRAAGLGAKFYDEGSSHPSMELSGEPFVNVFETNA